MSSCGSFLLKRYRKSCVLFVAFLCKYPSKIANFKIQNMEVLEPRLLSTGSTILAVRLNSTASTTMIAHFAVQSSA